MIQNGSTLLGRLLNAFMFTFSGGYARSVEDVFGLLTILATIELVVCMVALGMARQSWFGPLFWKLLGFAFLMWIVQEWPQLSQALLDSFIQAGLVVGGNVLTLTDIKDPGNIVDFGISVTALLMKYLSKLNVLTNFWLIFMGGLGGWFIVGIYILIAANVFKALVEYALISACLIFLVPFLAFEKTAPFGERVFGTFVAHAFRLLIYAAILSAALPILYTYNTSAEPKLVEVVMLLAGSFTLFVVALSGNAVALGMTQGAPALSFSNLMHGAGTALQAGAAVGAVGAAASFAGAAALRGAVTGASAMRAAAHVGAAEYRANYQAAHPHTHASPAGHAAQRYETFFGGAAGMANYATNRLTSGFRAAISQGRARGERLGE